MDKNKNGVFIFLGVAIILVGFAISAGLGSISDSLDEFDMYLDENDDYDEESYELIVEDGVLYMWDSATGEVWKKEVDPKSKWEAIEPLDRWE